MKSICSYKTVGTLCRGCRGCIGVSLVNRSYGRANARFYFYLTRLISILDIDLLRTYLELELEMRPDADTDAES
jgi:hypothetical protein